MDKMFFKGMTFGFYARNGYFSSPEAKIQIDKMAAIKTEWVCIVATVLQEAFYSTRQFRDFKITPADDELCEIIDYAHEKGIKVMLRPMIECWDGTQRSHVNFPGSIEIIPGKPIAYWEKWFESYCDLTAHYTRLATRGSCEAYCLDSELNNTVRWQTPNWLRAIETARKHFKGHLTCSLIDTPQFIDQLADKGHWFYSLDSLGSSMYAPAADKNDATIDEMVSFLKPIVEYNAKFAHAYGKPFYFGECGCCSTAGATKLPYYWNNGGGYDGHEQAHYMEAVIKAFGAEDWWLGMFWWKWDEQNHRPQFKDDPAGDKGFTIDGKPTMEVFKDWRNGESLR